MKTKLNLSIRWIPILLIAPSVFTMLGCGKGADTAATSASGCAALSGTAWTPNIDVTKVSESKHNAGIELGTQIITASGPVIGLQQPTTTGSLVTISGIKMPDALGTGGSLTLMAEVTGYPSALQGGAYAFLVSLKDSNNVEWVGLPIGSGQACLTPGLFDCSSGSCTSASSNCKPTWPSAYFNRGHYDTHQTNSPSVNTFPTCNWTGGSTSDVTQPACAFNSTFFDTSSGNQLPFGSDYRAQYLIVADSYSRVGTGQNANLKVTALTKKKAAGSSGALDLNFIIVGSGNVADSRTDKGKQNLNTLATSVADYFAQANSAIGVGAVNAYEYSCETGGDTYQSIDISKIGELFKTTSALVPASSATKAINIFLVSQITTSDSNFTILGVDGAIGGPLQLGTEISGLLVSTFDDLSTFNASCPLGGTVCGSSVQDSSFHLLGTTVAHEAGHFLGLNHLSESTGATHDIVFDTPTCSATESIGGGQHITVNSCLNDNSTAHPYPPSGQTCKQVCTSYSKTSGTFCPAALECEFNYLMWWTSNNYNVNTKTGDGNLFSPDQGEIMNYHPIVQ